MVNSPYNQRQDSFAETVVRGDIVDRNGNVLATTDVAEDGTETRSYPYGNVFSHVIGYSDPELGNTGLESVENFELLTSNAFFLEKLQNQFTDSKNRGDTVVTTLDADLQQASYDALGDNRGAVVVMEASTGKILSMVSKPDYDPNSILSDWSTLNSDEENSPLLNRATQGSYAPGSTFKIITASACLEEGVVSLKDNFSCPGYRVVEDRRIRCHKVGGHGAETFVEGIQNSCNPVFIDIGLRLGVDNFCKYFRQFGLLEKTGVDLPGEAGTIMHKQENIGTVELATISFGQSFQVTPIQLAATVSSLVNGGTRVTPHFGVRVLDEEGKSVKEFSYDSGKRIVSRDTSETMQKLLEGVVSEGSGKNAYVEGYHIGGKTATSQTLPRSANKYISSFVGFAPADDPQILGMCVIYNPQGIYYGGTIAAPVIGDVFEKIFPYLGIEKD